MDYFDISSPTANQILVWSDIEQAFINVDPTVTVSGITGGLNISNQGSTIFQDVSSGNLRFRNIIGGNGITLNDYNTYVEISFDGDATTLNGFSSTDFFLKDNNLSDGNVNTMRSNLDVYSIDESHFHFMETNGSNIPDKDNTYDLGSNGRRYADIYAKTFHGTATLASSAEQLSRNNALDGQVLTWDDGVSRWIPKQPTPITITGATDLYREQLQDRSILRYNANRNRWEPELFELGDTDGGSIADIENIGNGLSVYRNRTGFVANFRTLRAGINVSLRYNFNDDEIVIDASVPQNTDELVEGTNNLYYTTQRFNTQLGMSNIRQLNDVQNGTPSINQGLLWNGTEFRFRNVAVDIYSSNDIPEGNANLYYTETRVRDVIGDYLTSPGITLNQLSDVNSTHSNKNVLVSNGTVWQSRNLVVSDLSDVDVSSISDFDVLVWNASNSVFTNTPLPQRLIDLSETTASQHFNNTSFNAKISAINSDQLSEGLVNKYLTPSNLLTELSNVSIDSMIDVNLQDIDNNNVLVWDALNSEFITRSINDVFSGGVSSIFELDEVSFDIIDINDGDVLEWDSSTNSFTHNIRYDEISKLVDVSFTNLNSGETLVYDGSSFINAPSLPFELTSPNVDQLLAWDGSKFVNVGLGDIGSLDISVSDLSDVAVNFADLNTGDSLVWDNTVSAFVSGPSAQFINIRDINGMDIDSINNDQTMRWDGFNFIPANLPYFNPTQFNDGDVLVFDQLEGAFVSQDKWEHLEIDYTAPVNNAIFIYDSTDSNYKVREMEINNLKDVNDISSDKINERDHVLRWNDVDQSFDVYAPRIIVDVMNDLDDVDIVNIKNGQIIAWNDSQNKFNNVSILLSDLFDVSIVDIQDGQYLFWDGTNNTFNNDFITLNDLYDVDDTGIIREEQKDHVLRWNDLNQTFDVYAPRIIVDVLNDLDDINIINIENGHTIYWDEIDNEFKNGFLNINYINEISISSPIENETIIWNGNNFVNSLPLLEIGQLTDVDLTPGVNHGDILTWNETISQFVAEANSNLLSNLMDVEQVTAENYALLNWDSVNSVWRINNNVKYLKAISFNKNVFIETIPPSEPTPENPSPDDGIVGTPFNFDEFFVDLTYHYREVTEDIDFKLVLDGVKDDARFLIIDIRNPSNYAITLSTIDETNAITAIDKGNDFDFNGNSLICLHSVDGLNWKAYSYFHPIGNTLPSFATDTVNDKEVFIYDDTTSEMVSRTLTTDDLSDIPTVKNDNDLLVWDGINNEYKSTKEVVGTIQNETYFTTSVISTAIINPLAASYQLINATVDTDYTINDITLNSNTAFKSSIIVDNPDNYALSFSPETTGTIEFVGASPANYNGKHKIDMLTFDGLNWIFDVKKIV